MKRYGVVLAAVLIMWSVVSAQSIPEDVARIHYSRPDAAFTDWTLHVWEDTTENVSWEMGLEPTGEDDFGVFWEVGLTNDAEQLGFIIITATKKTPART